MGSKSEENYPQSRIFSSVELLVKYECNIKKSFADMQALKKLTSHTPFSRKQEIVFH